MISWLGSSMGSLTLDEIFIFYALGALADASNVFYYLKKREYRAAGPYFCIFI